MNWKEILKIENNDLERELQNLIEDYGFDKDREDFEEMTDGWNTEGDVSIEVDFEDGYEGDEDLEEEEIFELDEGWYRIVFTYKQNEFAVADFTYNSDYQMNEFDPDVIGGKFETVINQLEKL